MFLTFEGIDKSGKTTQAKLLTENFRREGFDIIFLREPGGTGISEKIRDVLLDSNNIEMFSKTEFLLYSASRAQLVNQVIIPALKEHKVVICDRFYDSSTAYQGFGRGLDLSIIQSINNFASGIKPDITIFIDIDQEESKKRMVKHKSEIDRLESSGEEFFNKVRAGYFKIAENETERFKIFDGRLSKEILADRIWAEVQKKIKKD